MSFQISESELRQLRLDGKSFKQIAAMFGTSVGAVAGKCRRLGLCQLRQVKAPNLAIELPIPEPTYYSAKQRAAYKTLRDAVRNTK